MCFKVDSSLTKGINEMFNLYEIYTKNPVTGQGGWDIQFVVALDRDDAATFPFFDQLIMRENGFGDDIEAVKDSGFGMTEAVYETVYGVAA